MAVGIAAVWVGCDPCIGGLARDRGTVGTGTVGRLRFGTSSAGIRRKTPKIERMNTPDSAPMAMSRIANAARPPFIAVVIRMIDVPANKN